MLAPLATLSPSASAATTASAASIPDLMAVCEPCSMLAGAQYEGQAVTKRIARYEIIRKLVRSQSVGTLKRRTRFDTYVKCKYYALHSVTQWISIWFFTLIFTEFKNPAEQPIRAPPGNVSLGMALYPPSFRQRAP